MDRSATPANDLTPRSASEWLIAMGARPRDRLLRARFDSWLAASADNRRDWEEINGTWEALGTLAPPRLRHRRILAGCLAASIALILGIGWGPDTLRRLQSDYVTSTAELRTLTLEDGSEISLGPQTALDVTYSGHERRLRLREGEAFFVVAPGDRRPFVVEAGGFEARDIGTAFDVTTGAEGTVIAVREGLVEVTPRKPGQPAERVHPGSSLRIDRDGARHRLAVAPAQIASWRQHQLVVESQSVEAVVSSIRPYFSGTIVVRGEHFARQPLTGVYDLADPVAALRAVAAAQGAGFHRISPWLVVLNGD
jgi:transmembrane sensor